MDLLKIIKCNVFLVSFAMFCYQLNIATLNLMNPPTVDSTNERSITVDDLPIVTICPTNQTNYNRLKELGYVYDLESVLLGNAFCNLPTLCTSWGAHENLSFEELKDQIFNSSRVDRLYIEGGEFKNSSVFIPGFGLCKETSLIDYDQKLILDRRNLDDTRVWITDRSYRSYFMPDISSHVGKEILLRPRTKHFINVKIQERYNCKKDDKQMSEKDFKKCVDEKIQEEFERNIISCVPPWLSDNKQCNQTYLDVSIFFGQFLQNLFYPNYIDMVGIMSNIRFEEECRQSCKEKTYIVNEKGAKNHYVSQASVTFNQKVLVTEKVANYDMFKYIIDVGSSLGLWLGLSILGLHDLVVMTVQFVKNTFIIKKIKSAVTK